MELEANTATLTADERFALQRTIMAGDLGRLGISEAGVVAADQLHGLLLDYFPKGSATPNTPPGVAALLRQFEAQGPEAR